MKKGVGQKVFRHIITEERVMAAMPLYSGKTREEVKEQLASEMSRRMGLVVLIGMLLFIISFVLANRQKEEDQRILKRPAAGEAPLKIPVLLEIEEGLLEGELELGAHRYSEEEIEEFHTNAERQLRNSIHGANKDLLHITEALQLPTELPECSARLSWHSDHPELVTAVGEVRNEELSEPTEVTVEAKIFYGEEYRIFAEQITVLPKAYTKEELAYREGMAELQEQELAERTKESFFLPETVLGMRLLLPEERKVPTLLVCTALAVVLFPTAYYGYFNDIETKKKKRIKEAKEAYKEFMTKLSLLMAAGLSSRYAWKRLTEDYIRHYGNGHVLAKELFVTESELENGRSETSAYEAFGERLGIVSYQRLASLLAQHVAKGVQGMQQQLLSEAREVLAQEREQIKLRGEEAGTKLLLPTMGLLVLVFAILLVPAFASFS